jgi:hypothetical protein
LNGIASPLGTPKERLKSPSQGSSLLDKKPGYIRSIVDNQGTRQYPKGVIAR